MLQNKTKILILIPIVVFCIFIVFSFLTADRVSAECCNGYCCNGPSRTDPGDCASADCPACGNDATDTQPWRKYECFEYQDASGCYRTWTGEDVCALGDKCISGEKWLRPGNCECGSYGSTFEYDSVYYKLCCDGPTPVECTAPSYLQDAYYPDEGICPAGSQTLHEVTSCPVECGSCQYESGGACYDNCSGADTQCGCTSCTNCDSSDGWVNVGSTYSCCNGNDKCTCQNQEYHDYYCLGTSCTPSTTNSQVVHSSCNPDPTCAGCTDDCSPGQTRCSPDGNYVQNCTECDDDPCLDWCDYEPCSYGCSNDTNTCNSAAGCYWNNGCNSNSGGIYPYYWPNDPCGDSWCWSQCPQGGCCCHPHAWCCWDAGYVPPTNCSCGEAPCCCPSNLPIALNKSLCGSSYCCCYPAGTLNTGCNGYPITAPLVTTNDATSIGQTSAQLSGNVTNANNANPDQRVLEWGTVSGSYSWSHDCGSGGTGVFSYTPTDLTAGTTYYFRAKAHNTAGWGYGSEKTFKINSSPTVPPASLNAKMCCGGGKVLNLSWDFADNDPEDGMSMYRIQIWDNADFTGNKLLDTNEINTNASSYPPGSNITYSVKHLPLSPTGKYYWRIKVWDKYDYNSESDWVNGGEIIIRMF